jgi:REP element-mobilizing transposase RayT
MSLRDKNLVPNEYYHIYNRGNGKNVIFHDNEDYYRFIKLLYLCNSEKKINFRDLIIKNKIDAFDFERSTPIVSILAWVLMPNHFHIILISNVSHATEENQLITEFMHKVSTSYVMYFNKKYKRTGSLFEGHFKSKHIGEENYFNYIFAYVHLNPIKLIQSDWKEHGIKNEQQALDYITNFQYSSFIDYFGKSRKESKILTKEFAPDYLHINHAKDIFNWIKQ